MNQEIFGNNVDPIDEESEDTSYLDVLRPHSHIRGLGLNDLQQALEKSQGMVGQCNARREAGLIVKMVKEGQLDGRCMLLVGEPGTGKTSIAIAMAKTLGDETPFTSISGSEDYSIEMTKMEAVTQAMRKSICVRFKIQVDIVEGEVTDIHIEFMGSDTLPVLGQITMKTTSKEKTFNIGRSMFLSLQKHKVKVGDVINIEKDSATLIKLGRIISRAGEHNANGPELGFVLCPQGELEIRKEVTKTLSLHEIDMMTTRPEGFLGIYSGEPGKVTTEIRNTVNQILLQLRDDKSCEFVSGVLFIDGAHMLGIECFAFLNSAIESGLAPLIVMSTNRDIANVSGTAYSSAHGIPMNFLDRTTIIRTVPYTLKEIQQILSIRCEVQECQIESDALAVLTRIAASTSLPFAIKLIPSANMYSRLRESPKIATEDVKYVYTQFWALERPRRILDELAQLHNTDLGPRNQAPARESPQVPARESLEAPIRESPEAPTRESPEATTRESPEATTRESPEAP